MKNLNQLFFTALIATSTLESIPALAADGTWTSASGGSWADAGKD